MPLQLAPFQSINDQFLTNTYNVADTSEFRRLAEMLDMNKVGLNALSSERDRALQVQENAKDRELRRQIAEAQSGGGGLFGGGFLGQLAQGALGALVSPLASGAGTLIANEVLGGFEGFETPQEKRQAEIDIAKQKTRIESGQRQRELAEEYRLKTELEKEKAKIERRNRRGLAPTDESIGIKLAPGS